MMKLINIVIDDTYKDKKEDENEDDVSPQQTGAPTDVLPKVFKIELESTIYKYPQINKGPLNKNKRIIH